MPVRVVLLTMGREVQLIRVQVVPVMREREVRDIPDLGDLHMMVLVVGNIPALEAQLMTVPEDPVMRVPVVLPTRVQEALVIQALGAMEETVLLFVSK